MNWPPGVVWMAVPTGVQLLLPAGHPWPPQRWEAGPAHLGWPLMGGVPGPGGMARGCPTFPAPLACHLRVGSSGSGVLSLVDLNSPRGCFRAQGPRRPGMPTRGHVKQAGAHWPV